MHLNERQNRIMTGFVLLSLLLHLLLLLIPKDRLFPVKSQPEPVYVEIRPPEQRDRELDLPVRPELEKPREKPAKRLGPADQVVEQEMAPEGQDTEDRPPAPQTPPVKPEPPAQQQPSSQQTVKSQEPVKAVEERPDLRSSDTADRPTASVPREPQKPQPLPDLQSLTQISPNTLARIESDWRKKYREDVLKGDTVWMDTEVDLLSSFMRRFRDYIYGVWNYPRAAAERNQQGTCLLRITVDREGNVLDVQLLESSGYRILDQEAIRAVRTGGSYGPLPRAYKNPDLKIMAFFQYRLGSRRPYLY